MKTGLGSLYHDSNVKAVYYRTLPFPITPFFNANPVWPRIRCAKLEHSHASRPDRTASSFETVPYNFQTSGCLYLPSVAGSGVFVQAYSNNTLSLNFYSTARVLIAQYYRKLLQNLLISRFLKKRHGNCIFDSFRKFVFLHLMLALLPDTISHKATYIG